MNVTEFTKEGNITIKNFSIDKKELQEALVEHCKVVPIRSTLPILNCALFSLYEKGIRIKTTDLEQTIISQQKSTGDREGSFAVPINKLLEKSGKGNRSKPAINPIIIEKYAFFSVKFLL